MADINIFALGGQDENGKNTFIIEVDNDIYVVNSGIKVPINNRNGIDGIICDYKYLIDRKDRIKGVFISHAHDESFAALPWLIMDIKGLNIYSSPFTLKAIQDRLSKYKIGHSDYKLIELTKETQIGNIKVNPFELANSIAGSLGFNFKTSDGDILFMTNYTIDDLGPYGKTDLEAIKKQSSNTLALLVDGKTAHLQGKSSEMKTVKPLIESKFKEASNDERIIIGAYDEEMFTLHEILELAIKYNRPVAFYGRVYDFLYKSLLAQGKDVPKPQIIDYRSVNKVPNAVVLVTGTWSRLYQRFVRIAQGKDVFLKIKTNDVVIMIAPPVNGLEVEGSQALDEVAKIAANITDVSDKDYYRIRPTGNDIEQTVKVIKPKYVFPIGALYRYLVVATKHAIKAGVTHDRNIVLQNGKIAWLKDGKVASQNKRIKDFGDVIIDGFGVGDISYEVIRERKALAAGGLVSIVLRIGRKSKKPIGEIQSQLVGVATKSEIKFLQEQISNVVIQKIDEIEKWEYREIQNTIRKRVKKVLSKLVNKEPLVIITFFEV